MSKGNARELPKMRINGREYYCDRKLQELIAVDNPHDRIPYKEFVFGLQGTDPEAGFIFAKQCPKCGGRMEFIKADDSRCCAPMWDMYVCDRCRCSCFADDEEKTDWVIRMGEVS